MKKVGEDLADIREGEREEKEREDPLQIIFQFSPNEIKFDTEPVCRILNLFFPRILCVKFQVPRSIWSRFGKS